MKTLLQTQLSGTVTVQDDNTEGVTLTLGGVDATAFSIVNGNLVINQSPNFEAKASYQITITATDAGVGNIQRGFHRHCVGRK